jgi:ADP-L-glycero-D-manno-heptose 6-epimerase
MILVTGGAGFIGSNIVAALAARGQKVVVCDWLGQDEKWRNIAAHELFDLIVPEKLFDFLSGAQGGGVEAIVHMGAISTTTERDADKIVANNLRLTMDLWHWCATHGRRFIYASSAATYGDGSAGFEDVEDCTSLARYQPLNAYGWSKHAFDRWAARCLADRRPAPPQHVGLKFFNVYGPNEYHKGGQRSVVHQIYPFAADGKPFALFKSARPDYEDGGQMRDFVWVGDCVAVILWLLDTPTVSGLFNLGSGKARSFKDLASAVYQALGKAPQITYRDMPDSLVGQYQYFTEAPLKKLRSAGYTAPMTSLEDGVRDYVQTYLIKANPYR